MNIEPSKIMKTTTYVPAEFGRRKTHPADFWCDGSFKKANGRATITTTHNAQLYQRCRAAL